MRSRIHSHSPARNFSALLACLAICGCDPPPDSDVPKAYKYDIANLKEASAATGEWVEIQSIPLPFRDPRAIACVGDGTILAAGDRAVVALAADGKEIWRSRLSDEPRCLGAGSGGKTYVGFRDHVMVLGASGAVVGEWTGLGENAVITSVAVGPEKVWVADAGSRKVAIFDLGGRLVGYLAPPDPFVAPSPFFDLTADSSGGVWVVNPGCLRVEHYSADGARTTHWGGPSMDPSGFAGCCNPIHIALLPDGGFATSEKGIPRVKTYRPDGSFSCIVAGPKMFAEDTHGLDLAAATTGDILVLDREKRTVRLFSPKRERKP